MSKCASSKPRRFVAGIALPTAAAAALTFTATGAAVATSTRTQAATVSQNSPAAAAADTGATPSAMGSGTQAIVDNALARSQAAVSAARSAKRKDLVARERVATRLEAANRVERANLARAHAWQLPIRNAVQTSGFGWRWGRLHAGEDFAAPVGTDLVSMSKGTVTFTGEQSGYGVMVKIRYWDGTVGHYAHMSTISVNVGQSVEAGEVVGQSGNTGESTGPHLHLEIHPNGGSAVDPVPWLADHKIPV